MLHLRFYVCCTSNTLRQVAWEAGGLDMTAARRKAHRRDSHVDHVAVVDEAVSTTLSRRARLMGASALAGGALHGLAIAAGIVTVFGASPAFAQCYSTMTGLAGDCTAVVPTGANATAIGKNANATGTTATAYGTGATANGLF